MCSMRCTGRAPPPSGHGRARRRRPISTRSCAGCCDAVERGAGTPEAIGADAGSAAAVIAGLTELELLGLIRCEARGRYIRCVS